ncbi:hypothetical protein APR41_02155 [Salegentibacter salinarum]|uniref:Uncharacterized protein n=1 Tax=Salegentibacter salinarum TaxID=447422 RepID=A0A2N0U490_9FLAO|nr:hypothetical protein [Salegentibacter salinarum]PKD21804.1 hypothetical protein APR41_02155 [Salegentibacter salinarum]SKB33441.1 hypothetical protein SAMN05660903_00127 [Salegentibacter salinarum]
MKKIIYFLPALLFFFSCSSDSSDDLPGEEEAKTSKFTVEFLQSGDTDKFEQEISFAGSPVGWENTETGAEVDPELSNSEGQHFSSSFSYSTEDPTTNIRVIYQAIPFDLEEELSLDVTFKIYKNGELIDTKEISINNDIIKTHYFDWLYFADEQYM